MFTVIIPVKKNTYSDFQIETKLYNNESLLSRKIDFLKKIDSINEIIIATDSEEALIVSKNKDVKSFWRDESHDEFTNLVYDVVKTSTNNDIIWSFATTPFLNDELLRISIEDYLSLDFEIYDSLITCTEFKRYILDENGPINFRTGYFHKSTEQLGKLYMLINGYFIMSKELNLKLSYPWGKIPYRKILNKDEAIEIRDYHDFEVYTKILLEKVD